MVVSVNARAFKQIIGDFAKGSKVMFNFKSDGVKLYIEILKDFTVTTSIPCVNMDNDWNTAECTFFATKALSCVNNKTDVTITFTDAAILITQDLFSCTLIKEYEARRDYVNNGFRLTDAYANRLKYLTHAARSMSKIAKELKIAESDPIFVNKKFYMKYLNTVFVDKMDYPECCIPLAALKEFVYLLDERAEYCFWKEKDVLYFRSGIYEFWVPVASYKIGGNEITAIEKELARCSHVATISFSKYLDALQVLSEAFPNQQITFTVGENQFQIGVSTNNTSLVIGDVITKYILSMQITTAQLQFICSLFGEDAEIKVKRGGYCLCLESGQSKDLLMSGVIY